MQISVVVATKNEDSEYDELYKQAQKLAIKHLKLLSWGIDPTYPSKEEISKLSKEDFYLDNLNGYAGTFVGLRVDGVLVAGCKIKETYENVFHVPVFNTNTSYQKQGHGRRLFGFLVTMIDGTNYKYFSLNPTQTSLSFWQKMGMRKAEARDGSVTFYWPVTPQQGQLVNSKMVIKSLHKQTK